MFGITHPVFGTQISSSLMAVMEGSHFTRGQLFLPQIFVRGRQEGTISLLRCLIKIQPFRIVSVLQRHFIDGLNRYTICTQFGHNHPFLQQYFKTPGVQLFARYSFSRKAHWKARRSQICDIAARSPSHDLSKCGWFSVVCGTCGRAGHDSKIYSSCPDFGSGISSLDQAQSDMRRQE